MRLGMALFVLGLRGVSALDPNADRRRDVRVDDPRMRARLR
jgi:hypothetical protein